MADRGNSTETEVVFDVEGREEIVSEVVDHVDIELVDKIFDGETVTVSSKIHVHDTTGQNVVSPAVFEEPERYVFNTVDIETTSDSSQAVETHIGSEQATHILRPLRTRKRLAPRPKTRHPREGRVSTRGRRKKTTKASPNGTVKVGSKKSQSTRDRSKSERGKTVKNEKIRRVKKEQTRKANMYLRKGLDDPTSAPEVANIPEKDRLKYGLEDLASGKYKTVSAAAAYWRVHAGKLYRRHRGDIPWDSRHGPAPVLTGEEEDDLANWILTMSKRGFPVSASLVRDAVQSFFKRDNSPFINGRPSYRWYYSFLRRNSKLSSMKTSTLALLCDVSPSKAVIDEWFRELKSFLLKLGVADKPWQIFNYAETGFEMNKKTDKIVVSSQAASGKPHQNCLKRGVKVGMCVGADGRLLPPFIIYRGLKQTAHWDPLDGAPVGSGTFLLEKDGKKQEAFSHWMEHHFVKNIGRQRPVVLLLGSHQNDISYKTFVTACQQDVYLFRIPHKAASLLQPLDVGSEAGEGPFRSAWITRWVTENRSISVNFSNVARVINCAWKAANDSEAIRTCFIQSGIQPLDREMIDDDHLADGSLEFLKGSAAQDEESLPAHIQPSEHPTAATTPNVAEVVFCKLDEKLDKTTRETYRSCIKSGLDLEETPLFSVWKKLYVEAFMHQSDSDTSPRTDKLKSKRHCKYKSSRGRKSSKYKKDEVFCPVCDERYGDDGGEDWIGCDGRCQSWYHVNCLPPEVVTPALLEEKEMVCPDCLNAGQT